MTKAKQASIEDLDTEAYVVAMLCSSHFGVKGTAPEEAIKQLRDVANNMEQVFKEYTKRDL